MVTLTTEFAGLNVIPVLIAMATDFVVLRLDHATPPVKTDSANSIPNLAQIYMTPFVDATE
jgi:hypothetical protein